MKKMIDEQMKEVEKAGKQLRKDLEDLRNAFPNHWSYSWDNPFQRLNRASPRALLQEALKRICAAF